MTKEKNTSTITAFKVGKIEGNVIFKKDDESVFVEVPSDFFANNEMNVPGYLVTFPSGKMIFLNDEDFEAQYERPIETAVDVEAAKPSSPKTSKQKTNDGQKRGSAPLKVTGW